MAREIKKKGLYVSYSAIDEYNTCGEKYRLNRIEKIKPVHYATPLFFGGKIDEASEAIFEQYKKDFNGEVRDYKELFLTLMDDGYHLGKKCKIKGNPNIRYSNNDIQVELLEAQDIQEVKELAESYGFDVNVPKFVKYVQGQKQAVDKDELIVYNLIGWLSLYRKGLMLLDRLDQWAKERIDYVISIQRKFSIENEVGDSLNGLLDLECVLKGETKPRTLDLKTSTNPSTQYPEGCINDSMQLHIYSEVSTPNLGYVILDKVIRKREPRVRIHEILGEVSQEQMDETFDYIDDSLKMIKEGIFEKNRDSCFKYGKCGYYDLCHKGKMTGLVKQEYKKDKE